MAEVRAAEYRLDFSDPTTLYEAEAVGPQSGGAALIIRPVHHIILRPKRVFTFRPEGDSPEDFERLFQQIDAALRR